jgi:glutamine amidotransferase
MERYDAILVDVGTGNLHSVHNALQALGFNILITADPADLRSPGRVILPGVGAFGSFINGLRERGLIEPLRDVFRRGDPLFGICVGMQALFDGSDEMGEHEGLGLLPGRVVRFTPQPGLKIPHTGWNSLQFTGGCPLFSGLPRGCYTYFNHSYWCDNANPSDAAASTDYGGGFTSAVQRENLFGVQFHPEKSQRVGQKVLANFFQV